nr:immunoglobulin light chain junction region [Macaca mulatta]MOV35314.1 immunoglobulin light chain junction region [Macaca mulatta]MOV74510.1 immunoglobulin light chain junction region [Macaca mulatta]MOW11518.1 immunoglobulin light chain junction region [Macaca mulatta]
CMQALRSPWTF